MLGLRAWGVGLGGWEESLCNTGRLIKLSNNSFTVMMCWLWCVVDMAKSS
jgi:hypothetical protein